MVRRPLYLDLGCLCDRHTDGALEFVAKAVGEDPPDGFEPHPNPYLRQIVEMFTSRGLLRLENVRKELERWLAGLMHRSDVARPSRPTGVMSRWSAAELELTKLYLQSLPPDQFTLDDWMLLADYLVQRYLPADDMRTEAEWFASRSAMLGRVEAALGPEPGAGAVQDIVAALPAASVDPVAWQERVWGEMNPAQRAVIDFGRARCAEHVRAITESTRTRMRKVLVDHQEAVFTGDKAAAYGSTQTRLLDEFGTLNRDWRRIAVTEATENAGQGFVASMPPGARIRRVEKYRGACPFCRSIDGMIMRVVAPDDPEKDGQTCVWVGKTNVGRAASPRKRVNGELVERKPEELWWVPAGSAHPHCRGGWVRVAEGASADPTFEAWLASLKGANQES